MDDTSLSGAARSTLLEPQVVERRPTRRAAARAGAVVGRDAALVWAAGATGLLSAARGGDALHAIATVLVAALLAGVVLLLARRWGASDNRGQVAAAVGGPAWSDRSARVSRTRAFVLVAGAVAVGMTALVAVGAWALLWVVPGLLAGAGVADARRNGVGLSALLPRRRWLLVAVVPVVVVAWSLAAAVVPASSDAVTLRGVEWVRGHGGAGAVSGVEHWWYTAHPPKVGGVPTVLLGHQSAASHRAVTPIASPVHAPVGLPPVPSPTGHAVGAEGRWTTVAGQDARPAIATTLLRPDAVHTSEVVGLMRIDPSQLQFHLLSGTDEPGGTSANRGEVPVADRPRLRAVFNGGFRPTESGGGWFADGRTARPLQPGAASLVLRNDGTADVGAWGRDVTMDPHVVGVRQNLTLLVDHGQPVPAVGTNDTRLWGKTLGNQVLVWRSGIGVTADGALIYVGGPALSVPTLASTLVAAGAVRGMELDINTAWVNAFTYLPTAGGPVGARLLPDMRHGPERYLAPQTRDFVEVLAR